MGGLPCWCRVVIRVLLAVWVLKGAHYGRLLLVLLIQDSFYPEPCPVSSVPYPVGGHTHRIRFPTTPEAIRVRVLYHQSVLA